MKRLCVCAIVLGLALTTAPLGAQSDDHSVTAAASGQFADGSVLGPVALAGVEIGTGVFIEADGTASGTFHAVLQGSSLLGAAQEITLEGHVTGGTVDTDGRATFNGSASLDMGNGAPPLTNVPFSVTAGSNGVELLIDSVTLSATLNGGAITIE